MVKRYQQPAASVSGIKDIEDKGVDFGAPDAPLTPDELEEFGLVQFPLVLGLWSICLGST
jgi:phosphate transport system substrate-binding protein